MAGEQRWSRRGLLKSAAGVGAALAFPAVITRRAYGAEEVRVGFIGVKNRGGQNLGPLLKHAVAVCDVDSDVLAAAKARVEKANGKCEAYHDYRKLLENKEIDAVVISTPDHWHALPMIHACQAGKDVYCEKPLSLTVAEGIAMVEAARKYNRVVQTGSQQRSDHRFQTGCRLAREGAIGKVHTVRVGLPGVNYKEKPAPDSDPPANLDYDFWLGPAPKRPYNVNRVHYNFRFFWDYSGGQMTNWGAHHLDIAQLGLGMDHSGPVSVEGSATYDPEHQYEVPSTFLVTYTYAGGVKVICGSGHGFKGGTEFIGDKGSIHVNRGVLEANSPEVLSNLPNFKKSYDEDHYANWLECIKTRSRPVADIEIGHRSATLCNIGNIAIRTGRKLEWDPERQQVKGDAEQQAMLSRPYRAPWHLPG